MMSAETLDEFKVVYANHFGELAEYGVTKPPTTVTLEDRITIVQSVTLHHALLKSKAEIDQFVQGLACLGTMEYIKKYPQLLKDFFSVILREAKLLSSGTLAS